MLPSSAGSPSPTVSFCPVSVPGTAPLLGLEPYNKKTTDEVAKVALKTIGALEAHLTANTYLVGERITLADIFTAALLTRAFATVLDKAWREANPAVTRWYNTIVNQDAFKAVVANPVFAEEVIKYTAPKKEEKPKPAPAAEAPKPAPEAPKPKHPLEALGKPELPIDEWKRTYSNEDTPTAMEWFWKNYNPPGYDDELKLTFMANNLIGGFHARLEASRKYLFGCQAVFGANYDCVIRGVFLVRGQEHAPAFDVAPDWESYNFEKIDHTDPAARKYIEDIWGWEAPIQVGDKTLQSVDGHVFK
ncbi:Elongation factor 1-gamma 2 [Penicillium hetheringtonii]|uniref:Elongation factor 1-gamma 2 n=1 Tax=Penicillium hetheringtonii TaxID=911720 RepID=A0AAD6H2A6_9EURO|nr:Elongation factor 1-gamma 2 [Penicillium hetheringtonii]